MDKPSWRLFRVFLMALVGVTALSGSRIARAEEGRPAAPNRVVLLVGRIATDMEVLRLRQVLQGVPGVREVGFRPAPERPGMALATVVGNGPLNVDAVLAAARNAGFEAQLAREQPRDGERPREGGPRDGDRPREGERPRDGERPIERPRPEGQRAVFMATPVQGEVEARRLREALQRVNPVREVGLQPGERVGLARVFVAANGPVPVEALIAAARAIGVQLRLVEGGAPRDGDRPREGEGPRDGERPREGERPRDGERPKPPVGEGQRAAFIAGPIRSDAEALRLRQALERVTGVREVGIRPGEREGTGRVTVASTGAVPVQALIAAARALGVEMRLVEGARPPERRPEGVR